MVELGEALELLIDNRGKNPPFEKNGIPLLSGKSITDRGIDMANVRFISDETYRRWMPRPVRRGDVILTSEAPLGRVAVVRTDEPIALGQRIFGLRGRVGTLDTQYLYYAFQSASVAASLQALATGTTVQGIRQPALRSLMIPAPSYGSQCAIAEVLGALDDKIAANDRVMAASDQLVRARFQSLSGAAAIPLGRIAINQRQQVAPDGMDGATPYIGLEHIPRRMMWLSDTGVAKDVTSAKSAFAEGDVLFGKLRPYFHKVVRAPFGGICSTDILVVRAKDPGLSGFVLAAASSDAAVRETTAASEGTRMPRTKWADLSAVEVSWPGESAAREFGHFVDELGLLTGKLAEESRRLAYTRDELIPLLMSGRLRVKDAEKTVEGVL